MIAGSRAGIARLKAIAAITFLLAAGLAVWLFAGGGANRLWGSKAAPPAGTLEAAVVNAEWDQALRLLNTGNPKGSRSVALFVRGLALLASNRNNESLACFAQAQAPGNLRKWDHYTARLARSYPEIASAHYVRGDALARLGRWDRAIEEFGAARGCPQRAGDMSRGAEELVGRDQ
jgi:tetratricopeptide (TPR) repeat protein